MVLLLDEGAVGKDLGHTHVPELLGHDLEIVDEELPPRGIPRRRFAAGACDQERFAQPLKVELVVARRQEAVAIKRGQRTHRRNHMALTSSLLYTSYLFLGFSPNNTPAAGFCRWVISLSFFSDTVYNSRYYT